MNRRLPRLLDGVAYGLCILFGLDRVLKHLAVWHFFRRPQPEQPSAWPTVTLLQPITRGASNLATSLRTRARLEYPATIQHLLICDACDEYSQGIVSAFQAEFPTLQAKLIVVSPDNDRAGGIATKIRKLQIALFSPQRINWRGNIVQVERGGRFRYLRQRTD